MPRRHPRRGDRRSRSSSDRLGTASTLRDYSEPLHPTSTDDGSESGPDWQQSTEVDESHGSLSSSEANPIANPQENIVAELNENVAHTETMLEDDSSADCESKEMWTGSLETRSIKNSGKSRSDSFLCGITPLNTPYTPASLVKFMKSARQSQAHGDGFDLLRRRKKRRSDRFSSHVAPDNFIGTMMMMLGFLLSNVRDISNVLMEAFLPGIITRHPLFEEVQPWILNLIMICTLGAVVAIGAPIGIIICLLTAPLWMLAMFAYVILKLFGLGTAGPQEEPSMRPVRSQ